MSVGSDFTTAVSTAGGMLRGASETEHRNELLDFEKTTSGLNYLKDATGKAIDFMSQQSQQQAALMKEGMIQEGGMARKRMELANQNQQIDLKTQAEKAKHDYEDFMTVTPELAEGVFKSTNGKMDFRQQVGSRVLTKAFIPLVQIAARDAISENKPPRGAGGGSQKDLNALKAFVAEYGKRKKTADDPMTAMMARTPEAKAKLAEDQKWLRANEARYNGWSYRRGYCNATGDLSVRYRCFN